MMAADVKANIKQLEIKYLVAYLTQKYLQNLKYNIKGGVHTFYSILVGIPFILILSFKNRGWGGRARGFCLTSNGQIKFVKCETKVICRQSLNLFHHKKLSYPARQLASYIYSQQQLYTATYQNRKKYLPSYPSINAAR